jgi:putative tryptophan/tyrosine transport system substrate-binding protein
MRFYQPNRRGFVALIGGAAAAWAPGAPAHGQQAKLPTIGFLGAGSPSYWSSYVSALVHRLRELGWTEGKTVAIEYRWAEGRSERMEEIAAEFVRLKVDIIVTGGTPPVIAAKQATSVIPIVFAAVGNPVDSGLVATLARPGGNVTGMSTQAPDLAGKRIELLREVVSVIGRLAILANVSNVSAALDMAEAQAAAGALGLQVTTLEIRRAEEIAPALETLKGRAHALYVVVDPLLGTNRIRIHTLTLAARLPTVHGTREYVEAGGLMSYGPNLSDTFRRAADFTDKILRGTKPADIPVEQPTKFDLVINLTTAKALGLTIPTSFLLRADEVIE